jgi:hypothetical protein
MAKKYDFSGYATKNDLKCSDGRVIRKDAFKENDGLTVPLVWHHLHNNPENVLGHAILENREDGVYAYGVFNQSKDGQNAKLLVEHGDITALSIYANQLIEKNKNVLHGTIREVSLVMAGANPGSVIDNLSITHSDGTDDSVIEDEAIIYTDSSIAIPEVKPEVKIETKKEVAEMKHADGAPVDDNPDETVGDIFETLTEKQKTVVYAIVAEAVDAAISGDVAQSSDEDDENTIGGNGMKHNVFEKDEENIVEHKQLTDADFKVIMSDALRVGSFKEAFLEHTNPVTYGIENVDYLFPDAQTVANSPAMVQRRMEWVSYVMSNTYHSPFARVKNLMADITADAARAKGYVKASMKTEEVVRLLRRITNPTTVYKKQKLDRDDVVDITDLDIIAWLKAEMRVMLDEELARAILIGDGRAPESADKIDEACIRPIYTDDEMYAIHTLLDVDADSEDAIEEIIRARATYASSGSPTLFTSTGFVTEMLLLKDTTGRRIYATLAELETALRVAKIVEVPVMTGVHRDVTSPSVATYNLLGIVVNLKDYTIGADKGGALGMFDDFDIDFNQYKYLIETRCSGSLVMPKSAIVIEQIAPAG